MAQPKAAPRRETKAATPAKPFTLSAGWAALIFLILTLAFFHEVALQGKTFVSPDASNPAGFVRIGEQTLYAHPPQSLWQSYPLWNPYVFAGMPSFGSGAYNPLIYPPDWPLALVAKVIPLPEMTWLLLYYFLGGVFFFLLAREWGARAEGALIGAAAFVFAPNLVAIGAHGHGSQLVDTAYLPLMVWLAARWLRRGNLADLGWLALAGGFQFLRGHVQVCFYTWMAVGIYGLVDVIAAVVREPKDLLPKLLRIAGVGVGAALAFGVAGFYNLPLHDYAQYSSRGGTDGTGGVGMSYATQWSMAPYELPSVIMANFVGFGSGTGTYWGSMPFTDYPNGYMGIVAVLLLLPALLLRGRAQVFAWVLGLFALLVSFGNHFPLYGFLYDHLPQFKKFRIPVMIIVLFQLAVALGAAWGWSSLLERGAAGGEGKDKKTAGGLAGRLLLGAGALLVLCALVVAVGGEGVREAYVKFAMAHKPQFPAENARAAYEMFTGDMARVVLLGLATVALAWVALRRMLPALLTSALVLAVLLTDVWHVSNMVMNPPGGGSVIGETVPHSLDAGKDDVVDFLMQQGPPGSFRVFEAGVQGSNRLAGFGIGVINGYHAAKLRLFQDLRDPGAGGSAAIDSPPWWALLNVRYITVPRPLDPRETPRWLRQVFSGSQAVYENVIALPRVTMVGQYVVLPDTGRAVVDSVTAMTRDPRVCTFLGKDPHVVLGPVDGAIGNVMQYSLHEVDVDVNTPGAGLLRLADQWYPDWKATVDGKPVEVLRADHLLRAVVVPAGHHRVQFRYESASVRRGFMLSIVSIAIALALLVTGLLLGRRARAAAPVAGAPEAA